MAAVVTIAFLLAAQSVAQRPLHASINDRPVVASELARGWRAGQAVSQQNGVETRGSLTNDPSKAFVLGATLSNWQAEAGFLQTYGKLDRHDKTRSVQALFAPACIGEARDFTDLEPAGRVCI